MLYGSSDTPDSGLPFPVQAPLPRPDHIVIVVEENHSFSQVIGSRAAPYLNSLVKRGALLTNSSGVAHSSQPNYVALFAGFTDIVPGNHCPLSFSTPNLRSALASVGRTFAGYAEGLPETGATDCTVASYARKHNPWVNWQGFLANSVLPSENRSFTEFPSDLNALPTVSMVVPNLRHDMHDGKDDDRIRDADAWLQTAIAPYVRWAESHNSLLIITWDEDGVWFDRHIPTIIVGPMVRPGRYREKSNHYTILRTVLDMYGARPIGLSQEVSPLRSIWKMPEETGPKDTLR